MFFCVVVLGWEEWMFYNFPNLKHVDACMLEINATLYIYIYVHPPPRTYLCPLLVEGVNSTLCASFLQMPENTVKIQCFCCFLPSM